MRLFWDFLRVYGALMACAAAIVVLSAMLANCAMRMRRVEARVKALETALDEKLEAAALKAGEDARKQRRLLNENMANLTESMSRAMLAIGADKASADTAARVISASASGEDGAESAPAE